MAEYIDRILLGEAVSHGMVHYEDIMSMPTADVVEREDYEGLELVCKNFEDTLKELVDELDGKDKVLKQVYWERDTALHQLAEIGKGLGEKMDDVVERKHGKWIYNDMSRRICSNCGNPVAFKLIDGDWYEGNFCPNCGADMRGEKDGNIM